MGCWLCVIQSKVRVNQEFDFGPYPLLASYAPLREQLISKLLICVIGITKVKETDTNYSQAILSHSY